MAMEFLCLSRCVFLSVYVSCSFALSLFFFFQLDCPIPVCLFMFYFISLLFLDVCLLERQKWACKVMGERENIEGIWRQEGIIRI